MVLGAGCRVLTTECYVPDALESRIDDLYKRPLGDFAAARASFAKELKGPDRSRVTQLKKPTSVPWTINQVYWHVRPVFDALLREGVRLRRAQIAALEGRPGDVRRASQMHRTAIAAAVKSAVDLAEAAGVHPSREALAHTFEALSLETAPTERLGRLTRPLRPRGFEMLAGVKLPAGRVGNGLQTVPKQTVPKAPRPDPLAEEAKRRQEAEVETAERAVELARANVAHAQRAVDLATEELLAAEQRLEAARSRRSG